MSDSEYDLRESVKSLGKLTPVLKDAFGNVIDGLHRLELFPDWPCMTLWSIDTSQKLEAAKLALNTNRRIVSSSEISLRVELLTKSGLKPEEIAKITGLSERTIYRHIPQPLKKPEAQAISEGMKEKSQLTPVSSIIKTQETPQPIRTAPSDDIRKCQRCGHDCHITNLKRMNDDKDVCPMCRVNFYGHAVAKTEAKGPARMPVESWTQRKAQMSPQHSKMEQNLYKRLKEAGYDAEIDHFFCTEGSVPDFYFPKENAVAYVDGEDVHKDEEDDEALRDKVVVRHKVRLLEPLRYKAWSQTVEDDLFKRIVNELSFQEGNK